MLSLILLGVILIALPAYFLVRLHWVKMFQTTILMRSPPAYMNLPHWKVMVFKKFWVWDDVEFLPDPDCLRKE